MASTSFWVNGTFSSSTPSVCCANGEFLGEFIALPRWVGMVLFQPHLIPGGRVEAGRHTHAAVYAAFGSPRAPTLPRQHRCFVVDTTELKMTHDTHIYTYICGRVVSLSYTRYHFGQICKDRFVIHIGTPTVLIFSPQGCDVFARPTGDSNVQRIHHGNEKTLSGDCLIDECFTQCQCMASGDCLISHWLASALLFDECFAQCHDMECGECHIHEWPVPYW